MKLEDQVCTLEQAKKLKELGIKSDSLWKWIYPAKPEMISTTYGIYYHEQAMDIIEDNEGNEFDHAEVPAYTVAELGVALGPNWEYSIKADYHFDADTEAQERGHFLIGALQSGRITPEEVNNRLKQ